MKKRIIAVLCIAALMLTMLAGCNKGETPSTSMSKKRQTT